jgi:5-methylcytosine-specific restriction endonuclease McrA
MSKCKNCHNKICSANNKKRPEAIKASAARWRKNNPEKIKALNSATKSRRRKSERKLFSHDDWQSILRQYHLSCAYCGCGGNLTMDHVVPLIRGGRHSVGNIIPACRSCNSSKGGKFIIEWYEKLVETTNSGKFLGTVVEVDCQKVLGIKKAWELREQMKKDLPNNRQINVFHKEDGQKGLDRMKKTGLKLTN